MTSRACSFLHREDEGFGSFVQKKGDSCQIYMTHFAYRQAKPLFSRRWIVYMWLPLGTPEGKNGLVLFVVFRVLPSGFGCLYRDFSSSFGCKFFGSLFSTFGSQFLCGSFLSGFSKGLFFSCRGSHGSYCRLGRIGWSYAFFRTSGHIQSYPKCLF